MAAGQMASHRLSLNYNGFEWTADKAVDGCYDRATPDISRCCSCSQEVNPGDNFWRLDFDQIYPLMKLIVLGRGGMCKPLAYPRIRENTHLPIN